MSVIGDLASRFIIGAVRREVERLVENKTPDQIKADVVELVQKLPADKIALYANKVIEFLDGVLKKKE